MQWELHFLSVLFHPDSPHTLQIQAHDIPFPEILRLFPEQPHNPAAAQIPVFGRVTPEQKRLLVQALKEQGKTVAMNGDGVNDILALKDADCSIAMASGSEAASHVAQLVLLDNDFNKMPAVVKEGRRVVNNIGRTASLYLVKNIFSMLLAVFSMLFLIDYPLFSTLLRPPVFPHGGFPLSLQSPIP